MTLSEIATKLKNLSIPWHEQVELIALYHSQSGAGAGNKKGRPKKSISVWGIRDTAEALDFSVGHVVRSLHLARWIKEKPEMESIETFAGAFSVYEMEMRNR